MCDVLTRLQFMNCYIRCQRSTRVFRLDRRFPSSVDIIIKASQVIYERENIFGTINCVLQREMGEYQPVVDF